MLGACSCQFFIYRSANFLSLITSKFCTLFSSGAFAKLNDPVIESFSFLHMIWSSSVILQLKRFRIWRKDKIDGMFSSQWLQQHLVIPVLLHTLSSVLHFLPSYSGYMLRTGRFQFQLECTKLRAACQWELTENWKDRPPYSYRKTRFGEFTLRILVHTPESAGLSDRHYSDLHRSKSGKVRQEREEQSQSLLTISYANLTSHSRNMIYIRFIRTLRPIAPELFFMVSLLPAPWALTRLLCFPLFSSLPFSSLPFH